MYKNPYTDELKLLNIKRSREIQGQKKMQKKQKAYVKTSTRTKRGMPHQIYTYKRRTEQSKQTQAEQCKQTKAPRTACRINIDSIDRRKKN